MLKSDLLFTVCLKLMKFQWSCDRVALSIVPFLFLTWGVFWNEQCGFYLTFHSSDFSLYCTLSPLEVSPCVPSVFCMTPASQYQGSFPSKARSIPLRSCFSSLFLLQHHLLSFSSSLFSQISLLFSFMFHPIIFWAGIGEPLESASPSLPPLNRWHLLSLRNARRILFFFSSRGKFSKKVSGLTLPSVFALLCLLYWASSGVDLLQGFPGIWCYKWKTSCG